MKLLSIFLQAVLAVPLLTPARRDNHTGFDILVGTWRTHYRILRHRLSHDTVWYDCYGHSVVRRFWDVPNL